MTRIFTRATSIPYLPSICMWYFTTFASVHFYSGHRLSTYLFGRFPLSARVFPWEWYEWGGLKPHSFHFHFHTTLNTAAFISSFQHVYVHTAWSLNVDIFPDLSALFHITECRIIFCRHSEHTVSHYWLCCSADPKGSICLLFKWVVTAFWLCRVVCPTNTRHWKNVVPMLVHRLRRWPNLGPTFCQCLLFAEDMNPDNLRDHTPSPFHLPQQTALPLPPIVHHTICTSRFYSRRFLVHHRQSGGIIKATVTDLVSMETRPGVLGKYWRHSSLFAAPETANQNNTRCPLSDGSMLAQRRRRWDNGKSTLDQRRRLRINIVPALV